MHSIKRVHFTILGHDDVLASSVCSVLSTCITERGHPKSGGLADTRMGSVDRRIPCSTCGHDLIACPGHHGHRTLTVPVFHPCLLDRVYKVLRVVCYFCSNLLVDVPAGGVENDGKARFLDLTGAVGKQRMHRVCTRCDAPQPTYRKDKKRIVCEWPAKSLAALEPDEAAAVQGAKLTAYRVWLILRAISREHVTALGFKQHPEAMILRTLVIPPPAVRPSIRTSESSRSMGLDDLSRLLQEIIKHDVALAELVEQAEHPPDGKPGVPYMDQIMTPSAALEERAEALQQAVNAYLDTEAAGSKGAPVTKRRNVAMRLKGKEGRIRCNLNGKRVDQSARSVISPEASLDVDVLGVPLHIARTLTTTEVVCPTNIHKLTALVRAGGASHVKRKGVLMRLDTSTTEACRDRFVLQYGDHVGCFLKDGDPVVFNRQPSLHKLSMLSFRARILPGKTFRYPVIATTSLNADFDGDECNLHVPQDYASMVEVRDLMGFGVNLVTPQNSEVLNSLKQDSLLGIYLLSLPDVLLPRAQAFQCMMAVHYPRRCLPLRTPDGPVAAYSGIELLSMLLPTSMRLHRGALHIHEGMLQAGRLTKGACKAIVHYMWKISPQHAVQLLSDMQRLANEYLLVRGMSVGFSDCLVQAPQRRAMADMHRKLHATVRHIEAEGATAGLSHSDMEPATASVLASSLAYAGTVCQSGLDVRTNGIQAMVDSGSKGSVFNIAQIMGVVGQQFVEGARIHGRLPCFTDSDHSPAAHGFVRHSYVQGLTPSEAFHHAQGGREGLVDTSVKTATTGYTQRKLIKGMESSKVAYDGTVRNSNREVVQYTYGGDGYDATYLVKDELRLLRMSNEELQQAAATPQEHALLLGLRDKLRAQRPLNGYRPSWGVDFFVPFNASWLLDQAHDSQSNAPQSNAPQNNAPQNNASAAEKVTDDAWLDGWSARLQHMLAREPLHVRAYAAWNLRASVVRNLSHRQCKFLARRVEAAVAQAHVAPMEMVGALAAESSGEPATQLTLNSFHSSGQLHSVTQGVPRLKELLDLNKAPKTPCLTCPLAPPFCDSEPYARMLAYGLKYTVLHEVVQRSEVTARAEDADMEASLIALDAAYARVHDRLCPLALRFELAPDALRNMALTPLVVATRIRPALARLMEATPGVSSWWLMASPAAAEANATQVLRVRVIWSVRKKDKQAASASGALLALQGVLRQVLELHVCGMPGIHGAEPVRIQGDALQQDGSVATRVRWGIATRGTNLHAMLQLPSVDVASVMSNDVLEVWRMFGIEAAAKLLYYEIKRVLSFDSTNLHDRHIMLIVDTMTRTGSIMPMNRHGLNRERVGPLIRASFEQTLDVLTEAAVFGEMDSMDGVSENVMVGRLAPLGTGGFDLVNATPAPSKRHDDDGDEVLEEVVSSMMDAVPEGYEAPQPLLPALEPTSEPVAMVDTNDMAYMQVDEAPTFAARNRVLFQAGGVAPYVLESPPRVQSPACHEGAPLADRSTWVYSLESPPIPKKMYD